MMSPEAIAALISAAAALVAAGIATLSSRSQRAFEQRLASEQRTFQEQVAREQARRSFVAQQLSQLYVPVSMYLSATRPLFRRFFEASATAEEKEAIEHALREYNARIRELLINGAQYFDQDVPDTVTSGLLEHLVQWETVYHLKYRAKTWSGPVFAGIEQFGYRGFPKGVDEYFATKTAELRARL